MSYSHSVVLKPNGISNLERLLQFRLLGSIPRVSHLVGLGWDTCNCLSNKFPGDAVAAYLGTTLVDLQV